MDRAEFSKLPVGVALGLLYDATPGLASVQAPELVRPPKYDGRIFRKGGFVWMSEMLADDLRWWHGKKLESANGDGKYADSDRKTVGILDKWIAWREQNPSECWSGTRGDDTVTASQPSKAPVLRQSEGRRPPPPEDDFPTTEHDYGEMPF